MKEFWVKRRAVVMALGCGFAVLWVSAAAAAPTVNGTFPVPGVETNSKIVAGPEGNIWVALGGATENVARITPSGEVKEFVLGLNGAQGIAVGPEGKLWMTENEGVAKLSPSNPEGTVEATAIPAIKTFSSIVAGPDGKMWVATEETVLRFLPSNPAVQESKAIAELTPHDIDVSGQSVVIADGDNPRIVALTTAFQETDYTYGKAGGSQGLAVGSNGQIAFSDPGAVPEQIGLLTPPGPAQTSEQLGDPFGVAYGADQAFWFAQFAQGGVTRLTSTGQKTFLGGLPKESPRQIAPGPDNTLWVTLVKAGEESVARISGLEPPPMTIPPELTPSVPQTKIVKGPKGKVKTRGNHAKVTFRFSSTVTGGTFECALARLKKGKKAARTYFKPCKSPKSFSLKPGKYSFSVRAVSAGLADPSAAKRTFSVIRLD